MGRLWPPTVCDAERNGSLAPSIQALALRSSAADGDKAEAAVVGDPVAVAVERGPGEVPDAGGEGIAAIGRHGGQESPAEHADPIGGGGGGNVGGGPGGGEGDQRAPQTPPPPQR